MAVHIMVPTLQGVSAVQGIVPEDPDVPSVVCLNGSSQSLPISNGYYDFVKRGQGLIARDFGHDAWRVDLSAPVEMGDSWQLGLYLAHYFFAHGELGDGQPQPGDTVIWATGAVRVSEKTVEPVEGVERKLETSRAEFERWRSMQVRPFVVMCSANHALVTCPDGARPVPLDSLKDLTPLLDLLDLRQAPAPAQKNRPAAKAGFRRGRSLYILMLLIIVIGGGLAYGLFYHDRAALDSSPGAVEEVATTLPAMAGPVMEVQKVDPGQACAAAPSRKVIVSAKGQGHFTNQPMNQICAIAFRFPDPSIERVLAYAVDTGAVVILQFEAGAWRLPLPDNRSRTRTALIITLTDELSLKTLAALKAVLDQKKAAGMTPLELHGALENTGLGTGGVYRMTLERF